MGGVRALDEDIAVLWLMLSDGSLYLVDIGEGTEGTLNLLEL